MTEAYKSKAPPRRLADGSFALGPDFDQIGAIYCRYSTRFHDSIEDQVRECLEWAAEHRIHVPPSLISVAEIVKGSKKRREGLVALQAALEGGEIDALLVFRLSRLYRENYMAVQFVAEEVVERDIRFISTSENLDTENTEQWKMLLTIHGLIDENFLEATAAHVRAGQLGLFRRGLLIRARGLKPRTPADHQGPILRGGRVM